MTPSIRYATTEDDTHVAYSIEGDGPVCVHMPLVPWTNMTMMSELDCAPRARSWAGPRHRPQDRAVRREGAGLSEGATPDLGLDAQLLDLAAVVDEVAADRVALLAPVHSGPAAMAYAAQHPEQVSHLILWCAYARGADFFGEDRVKALRGTSAADWRLFTEYLALELVGWHKGGAAERVATLVQQHIEPQAAAAAMETLSAVDVTSMQSAVRVPTLVLQRRRPPLVRVARTLAVGIPNARLVYMAESAMAPEFIVGSPAPRQMIVDFLSEPPPEAPAPAEHSGVAALEEAIDGQLAGERPVAGAASPTGAITPREVEVLRLLANGNTNAEIAETLVLSVRTVERHLGNIYGKLDVRGRAEAVAVALRSGIA